MTDALAWRTKFGVIVPSTNTIVEPDFYSMMPPGVIAHISRIHIRDMNMAGDAGMERLLDQIRDEIEFAVQRVVTCEPDYMVMGMSAETFWGGVAGNRQFIHSIKQWSGLDCATGAEACERALQLFGAKRVGVVRPISPSATRMWCVSSASWASRWCASWGCVARPPYPSPTSARMNCGGRLSRSTPTASTRWCRLAPT